jgi:hypothetical protein
VLKPPILPTLTPTATEPDASAALYALSEGYYAVEHPALEDYLALTSGHTFGLGQECTDCFRDEPSIADTLEAKGKSWKSYREDLPQPCFLDPQASNYIIAHNPFLFYNAIRDNPSRCQQVVPLVATVAPVAAGPSGNRPIRGHARMVIAPARRAPTSPDAPAAEADTRVGIASALFRPA